MRYAVALLSFFENVNTVEVVEGSNPSEAMVNRLLVGADEAFDEWVKDWGHLSPAQIQENCFNSDLAISYPVELP